MIDKQELRLYAERASKPYAGRDLAESASIDALYRVGFSSLATPAAILALLDELEACKADAERIERNRDMWKAQCAEQARKLERHVPLYEAINKAAGELRGWWAINICIEKECASVEVVEPGGATHSDFPTNNERLDYTVCDALDYALSKARAMDGKDG